MTTWLLDASVILASVDTDDRNHEAAAALLTGTDPLASLDLAYYEVSNVAIRAWGDPAAAAQLVEALDAIGDDRGIVTADPALLGDAVRIASASSITVYDAAYVAASRRIGAELVSCDEADLVSRRLARLPVDAS